MTEKLVPHSADKGLGPFGVADLETIAADRSQSSSSRDGKGGSPQMSAQKAGAPETIDKSCSPARHRTRVSADHRVHRELNHPRNDQIEQRDKTGKYRACQKIQITPLQKKENETGVRLKTKTPVPLLSFCGFSAVTHVHPPSRKA